MIRSLGSSPKSFQFLKYIQLYSQLVKYRFFTLFLRKEQSGKRVSDKTAKWQKAGKERLQIATYRPSSYLFDVFIVLIPLREVSKLNRKSLEK